MFRYNYDIVTGGTFNEQTSLKALNGVLPEPVHQEEEKREGSQKIPLTFFISYYMLPPGEYEEVTEDANAGICISRHQFTVPDKEGVVRWVKAPVDTNKPGRSLTAFSLEGAERIFQEPVVTAYVNHLYAKDQEAGHHYHERKQEIIFCIHGRIRIALHDTRTDEQDMCFLGQNEGKGILLPPFVAHAVKAEGEATILVLSTGAARGDDDKEFRLTFAERKK